MPTGDPDAFGWYPATPEGTLYGVRSTTWPEPQEPILCPNQLMFGWCPDCAPVPNRLFGARVTAEGDAI